MSCTGMVEREPSSSSSMNETVLFSNGGSSGGGSVATLSIDTAVDAGNNDSSSGGGAIVDGQYGRCTTPIFGKSSPSTLAAAYSPPRSEMARHGEALSSPVAQSSSLFGAMTSGASALSTPVAGASTPISSGSGFNHILSAASESVPRRRMRGLVRRTHSPRNMVSLPRVRDTHIFSC
mmetsp:Transcript_62384/g.92669  ORF Transcript_62384/g.92669 Transcript_62384/m.92669 type:complete len:178 (-) Transcript_62384:1041-1574(-)